MLHEPPGNLEGESAYEQPCSGLWPEPQGQAKGAGFRAVSAVSLTSPISDWLKAPKGEHLISTLRQWLGPKGGIISCGDCSTACSFFRFWERGWNRWLQSEPAEQRICAPN
jgi:hypothetical protein